MVLLIAKNFQLVKFSQADFVINKPPPIEVDEGNWNQVQLSRLWKSNSVGDLVWVAVTISQFRFLKDYFPYY